jgi:hypothetical protein
MAQALNRLKIDARQLWRALLVKAVCYAVGVGALLIGLWPWALADGPRA